MSASAKSAPCCPLAGLFLPLGNALQSFGLALMIGGMLALGAFTAPAVFHALPRDMAAPLMASIFHRHDMVILVAMILVQVGEYFRWVSHTLPVKSRLNLLRLGLLALLTIGVIYSTQALNPKIAEMNQMGVHRNLTTPQGKQFDALHKRSESIYKLELLTAVLLVLLTPFVRPSAMDGDKTAGDAFAETAPTGEPPKDCCP